MAMNSFSFKFPFVEFISSRMKNRKLGSGVGTKWKKIKLARLKRNSRLIRDCKINFFCIIIFL